MKFTAKKEMFPTRVQRFLRWSQRLLFITGILALGYVGFTLVDARLYQVSAKRSLESQIKWKKSTHKYSPNQQSKRVTF